MTKTHDADIAFIRQLAELLKETDLSEIEVAREFGEDEQLKVRVLDHLAQGPRHADRQILDADRAAHDISEGLSIQHSPLLLWRPRDAMLQVRKQDGGARKFVRTG